MTGHRGQARAGVAGGNPSLFGTAWFFAISLALGAVAVYAGTPPALLPFVLVIGPAAVAIGLAWSEGNGALRRLLAGLTKRPQDRRWYLVPALPLVWALATDLIAIALGEPVAGLFDQLVPAIFVIPLVVLGPAIVEELAWRGYVLPRLLARMSPLRAALVLAVPWTLIHVFLFLPGQWYDLAIWPLVLSIVAYSILLTSIYVRTGGSVLLTALVHTGLNGVAPLMAGVDGDLSWAVRNILAAAVAIAVVALGGLRQPSRGTTALSVLAFDRAINDGSDPSLPTLPELR